MLSILHKNDITTKKITRMKKQHFLLLLVMFLHFGITTITAQKTFIHPGGKETLDELNFVKAKIQAGAQPWTGEWNKVSAAWALAGAATIPADENGQRDQAKRAYANALAYRYTGNTMYADRTIATLKAWNNVATYPITDVQLKLVCAWIGSLLGPAAELVRDYMTVADRTFIIDMFNAKFVASLESPSSWNGNVEATQIEATFSIAVFCEDEALFNHAVTRFGIRFPATVYLKSDGPTAITLPGASWYSPNFASPNSDGLEQETCRDWGHHTQFALSAFISAAEIAFHQGTDLYKTHQTRLVAGMELLAKQMTTGDLQGVCTNGTVTSKSVFNTFEIGYNHYHNVVGLAMTETEKVIPKIQTGVSDWDIFYETLTHNGVGGAEVALCETPKLGADQSICGKTSIVLNATLTSTTNKTISWSKDNVVIPNQTSTSLTVTQAGTYTLNLDSAGCKTSDNVVIGGTLAINLGADKELCASTTEVLDAGSANGTAATFLWNTGATTQSITTSKAGTYTVTISATNCTSVSDAIVVTSKLLTVTADTLCSAGIANLVASGGSAYSWYDVATGGVSLSSTATYSPSITTTKTYYVQDPGGTSISLGKTDVGGGQVWNAGITDFPSNDKVLKVSVLKALTINSIAVYVVNAGTSVTLNLKQGGTAVHTKTVTGLGAGKQTINLNFVVAPGEYILDAVGTTNELKYEASGATFPYTYPDYISFTFNQSWQSAWYGFFYDWGITAGNVCARTPVDAVIDNTNEKCVTTVMENTPVSEFNLYPNPASEYIEVRIQDSEVSRNENKNVTISNTLGQTVFNSEFNSQHSTLSIDVSQLTPGLYYVKIGNQTQKIIIQ